MAFEPEDLALLRTTIHDAVESAQEKLAQMVAKQFVEIRQDIQDIHNAIRKAGARQVQVEADLAEVGRNCELMKRRLYDLHTDQDPCEGDIQAKAFELRLDHLERELANIRVRLSSAV